MSNRFTAVLIAALVCATWASAAVEISIPSMKDSVMMVAYDWPARGPGRAAVFPDKGFDFASGPLQVLDVREKTADRELAYEVVQLPSGLQAVKALFTYELPRGGVTTLTRVQAKTNNISVDTEGRYIVKYSTSHALRFVTPGGYTVTYTNYPVVLSEEDGHVVAEVRGTDHKDVVFKLRGTE